MKANNLSSNNSHQTIQAATSFAEVIESSLDHFTAQCWQWDNFPSFGNLVTVTNNETTLIGCVTQIHTGSMDPMRYPFPYQKTEQELQAEQPQIFEFLKTTFTVQIIGYQNHSAHATTYSYLLPPKPAKIHTFVAYASMHLYASFFQKPHYLNLLFSFAHSIPNLDELLLALLHNLSQRQLLTQEHLEAFCQTFSLLTGNDYRRLKLFLSRVDAL